MRKTKAGRQQREKRKAAEKVLNRSCKEPIGSARKGGRKGRVFLVVFGRGPHGRERAKIKIALL